jgi:hypothetical protein
MTYDQSQYWLYRWIDEYGIRTTGDFIKVTRKASSLDRLHELSDAETAIAAKDVPGYSVLAGSRVDLSADLGCPDYECLVPQVDHLFNKIWHYFDTVVVDGSSAGDITSPLDIYIHSLQQRVRLLLHLRKIGAERHIVFAHKPRAYCADHFREHASAEKLDVLFDRQIEEHVVELLANEATIHIERRVYGWHYSLKHPTLEEVIGTTSHDDPSRAPTRQQVAREVFGRFCNALVADVSISHSLGLPLLQFAEAPWLNRERDPSADDGRLAALNMRLPMLGGVAAQELLKIREHNWPYFERYRDAVRTAIEEQQERAGSESPEKIAAAVVEKYVRPELADIERRLRIVKGSLAKKLGAAAFITGTAATVGAVPGVPLIVAAGIAVVGAASTSAAIPQIFSYVDERDKVKYSNWYFLWKAHVRNKH